MSKVDHVPLERLHEDHPRIRAEDWRSPLVARLTDEAEYADGTGQVAVSLKLKGAGNESYDVNVSWEGLSDDYARCLNTYQGNVITEFAALATACVLCREADLEITEVTRRGEKVDYWLGDREWLLEVGGTKKGDLDRLCKDKAEKQLCVNPFERDGFVAVSRFERPEARLWFFRHNSGGA